MSNQAENYGAYVTFDGQSIENKFGSGIWKYFQTNAEKSIFFKIFELKFFLTKFSNKIKYKIVFLTPSLLNKTSISESLVQ
jgi:hypothetical protein